ncbi:MAG: chromate efflux transporter [Dehalococcoidia bacterium]
MAGSSPPSSGGRLREVILLFGQLGVTGFGGPMAHISMIEREAVEKRGWLSRQRFTDALAATNLVPGPNSTEMAIHVGDARAGLAGAIGSGIAFIMPAFLLMLVLSWLYARYQTVPAVDNVFYGIKPAVIALIVVTAYRLFRGGVSDAALGAVFVASGALAYAFPGSEIYILIGAGLAGLLLYSTRLGSGVALVAAPMLAVPAFAWEPGTLGDIFLLCLRTGGLLFGGGYVMIPLMQHDVVETFGWMSNDQFLDGVALGQTTPGPIVITATFVGYQAAGLPGAVVATVAIFLPSFVFALLAARFLAVVSESVIARAVLKGLGAGVVGTILAATAHLGRSAFVDGWTVAIGIVALFALLRWRVHSAPLLGGAALAGLAFGALP